MTKRRPITGNALMDALTNAGIVNPDDRIVRLIIDVRLNHAVVMHVERLGDVRMIELFSGMSGVELREVGRD